MCHLSLSLLLLKNISSSDDGNEDDNPPPPSQDPPSASQLPKWVRATQDAVYSLAGIEYTETFTLVAKMNSIHLVLSLSTSFKWEVHQMDVKSSFLHGYLHEEIYMEQPTRFIQTNSSLVCRLKKFFYGLKQAPRACTEASPLLVGFTNSDWAGNPDDQKSTTGYVFMLGSGPITWACKKQSAISLSSAKAKYRGAIQASKETL
eukprot:PITA_12850